MVGQQTLDLLAEVRILDPQPERKAPIDQGAFRLLENSSRLVYVIFTHFAEMVPDDRHVDRQGE